MAIKNFLSFPVLISLLLFLSQCKTASLKTRSDVEASQQEETEDLSSTPSEVKKPVFLQKEAPKLGVILGPGGALAYGQIGFLQELENSKIPVAAIAGIEWGALVAGAYALANKAHSIEWKLLKLPVAQFSSKGFFASGQLGADVSDFNSFLGQVFKNNRFSDLEVPFACPYLHVAKGQSSLRRGGLLKHGVRSCWPHSPHFKGSVAGADLLGVKRAADYLRSQGAEVILYVDVLSKSPVLTQSFRKKHLQVGQFWLSQKNLSALVDGGVVDQVVRIGLGTNKINSYKSLRSIIRLGQVKSKSVVKEISNKYAY